MTDAMDVNPATVADPAERARLVLTQWHIDEATGDAEAADYADRLIAQLAKYGLTIAPGQPAQPASITPERLEAAGWVCGRRGSRRRWMKPGVPDVWLEQVRDHFWLDSQLMLFVPTMEHLERTIAALAAIVKLHPVPDYERTGGAPTVIHNPLHRIARMVREISSHTGTATVGYHPSALSKGARRRACCHGFWPDVYRHRDVRRAAARTKRRRGPTWDLAGCWMICGFIGEAANTPEKAVMKALRATRRLVKKNLVPGQ